jgi:hypothetical protein
MISRFYHFYLIVGIEYVFSSDNLTGLYKLVSDFFDLHI